MASVPATGSAARPTTALGALLVVLATLGRAVAAATTKIRPYALDVAGLALITAGAATWTLTAGLITAGASCLILNLRGDQRGSR